MTLCDWWPEKARPAEIVMVPVFGGEMKLLDERRGCRNQASVVIKSTRGRPKLHVCRECSRLDVFALCRREKVA